jgi:spoIIIJ-associated protein
MSLGLTIDDCNFEVIEESAKGLFAKTNYKVKATAKAKGAPEPAPMPERTPELKPAREPKPKLERTPKAAVRAEIQSESTGDDIEPVAADSDGDEAASMLNELFKLGDLKAKASVESLTGKYVNLAIEGKDAPMLTEDGGNLLDSLQYLANAMFSRTMSNGVRLTLDAASYRKERAETLEKLARDVASAVIDRQQEAVLDALPAHERRIIHAILKEVEGVETYSEGEEPQRRVVVTPSKP